MTNTRTKLDEAKYFLTRMKEEVANREPFKYNLSAFLSAARSVTFIMQSEYSNISGFSEWYEEKQNDMRTDQLMVFMKDKRNIELKQEAISPRRHISVHITAKGVFTEHVEAILIHQDGIAECIEHPQPAPPPPPPNKNETEVKYRWFFEDIPDKDVITLSQEYVDKLESLVQECEDKFASNLL